MNNIHISYDLFVPGQNYEGLIAKIKTLGNYAKIQKSFWYVNTTLTADQVATALWSIMDKNDSLYVVDASNKNASMRNVATSNYIIEQWNKSSVAA